MSIKKDEYLFGHMALGYKEMQKQLASYKLSQARSLRDVLTSVEPEFRDVERIQKIDKAIKFWEDSKEW